jgi:enoyl-CoA hydratase/carnithine racemase
MARNSAEPHHPSRIQQALRLVTRLHDSSKVGSEYNAPEYWRVTFDLPPLNIFGPNDLSPLNEIISEVETDEQVKVVVFDSAVEGFFLTHWDFLAKEDQPAMSPGPTGLQPLPDMRVSRASSVEDVH